MAIIQFLSKGLYNTPDLDPPSEGVRLYRVHIEKGTHVGQAVIAIVQGVVSDSLKSSNDQKNVFS